MLKALIINGSPRKLGNTSFVIKEVVKVFEEENVEVDLYEIGTKAINGCIACGKCRKDGKCVFDDDVNDLLVRLQQADALLIASPVYYASANGTLIALLDRLFHANKNDLTMKVGACLAIARRGGASATFDMLNKYFTISGMPVASSYYWNSVHGMAEGEVMEDKEGIFVAKMLARNMAFLMKSIKLGKEKYGPIKKEKREVTNFIR